MPLVLSADVGLCVNSNLDPGSARRVQASLSSPAGPWW
jgi:hypothetical protein